MSTIRLNWVVVIAGLIPLWGALFIVFTNMKVLNQDPVDMELVEPQKEVLLELDLTEEKPVEEKKGLFSGILGRFKQEEEPVKTENVQEDVAFGDTPIEEAPVVLKAGIGLPKGIRKLWGASMILIFLACLAYGSERMLDYAFKEYRWVIGTANPWTEQLAMNTMITTVVAALGVMAATLKTGIYLIRN